MTTTPHTPTDTSTTAGEESTTAVTRPAFTPPAPPAQGPVPGYGVYGAPQYGGPGVPPPPYGPHYVVPGAFPAPKRGLARIPRAAWLAAAAALTLVVILVAVVVAGNSGGNGSTSASSSGSGSARSYAPTTTEAADGEPDKLITSAQLPGMLLNPQEIADAVGQPGSAAAAKPSQVYTNAYGDTLASGQECLPRAYAAEQAGYQGTGFTAMRSQNTQVRVPNDDAHSWSFTQGMFAYPSRDAAEKALLSNIGTWKTCEGKSWSYQVEAGTYFWTAGAVQQIDTLVIAQNTQENGDGWSCWRGITLTGNVVADYTVCGKDFTPTVATQAAAAITAKAPAP